MKITNKEVLQSYILTTAKYDYSVYEKRILYRIIEILQFLIEGKKLNEITDIPQTSFLSAAIPERDVKTIELISHEECLKDKKRYASNFRYVEEESNRIHGARLVQKTGINTLLLIRYIHPGSLKRWTKHTGCHFPVSLTRSIKEDRFLHTR